MQLKLVKKIGIAECNIMGQVSTATGCETAEKGVLFPGPSFIQSVLSFDTNGDTSPIAQCIEDPKGSHFNRSQIGRRAKPDLGEITNAWVKGSV